MKLERLTCHTPVAAARAELIRRVDRTHPPHPFDQVGKKAPVWVVDPRTTVDHIGTVPLLTGREHRNIWEPGAVKLMSFPSHTSTRTTRQLVNNNPTKIAMSPHEPRL